MNVKYVKKLSNQGSYAKVYSGVLNGKKVLIKVNKDIDVDLRHENNISKVLQKYPCGKYFSKTVQYTKMENRQVLFIEWLENFGTLYDMVDCLSKKEILNLYNHILEILNESQRYCKFVHNDLHLNNILIVKTNQKQQKYAGNKILPYIGYKPILIDFGFSYCENVNGLNAPLSQTHRGMNPLVFNPNYDKTILTCALYRETKFKCFKLDLTKFRRNGMFNLKMSLFDFLCRQCGCSTYYRQETNTDYEDKQYKTITQHSERTLNEFKLNKVLQEQLENATPKYVQDLDILFQEWTGDIAPSCIQNGIAFWIQMYIKFYNNYLKIIYSKLESSSI